MNRNLEMRLEKCLRKLSADNNAESCRRTVSMAKRELQLRGSRHRIGFVRFFLSQIRYIGIKIWVTQLGILAGIGVIILSLCPNAHLWTPKYISMLLCGFSVSLFMAAVPFIYRASHYKMQEVEAATRISAFRILLAKLLIMGIGDIVLIAGVIAVITAKTSYSGERALLYLLFPFSVTCCVGIWLLRHMKPIIFLYSCGGICVLILVMLIWLNRYYPVWYTGRFSAQWAGICGMFLIACICQLRHLAEHSATMIFD